MKTVSAALLLTLMLMAMLAFAFNVQPANASGTIYIRADGGIDPPAAPITTADNITYIFIDNVNSDADGIVVERSDIVIDGAGYTVQGAEDGTGFSLVADNVTVRNTYVQNFRWGIAVSSSGCTVINNVMTYNVKWGVYSGGSDNKIIGNRIANTGLNLVGYDIVGVYLGYGSGNNTIADNHIEKNGYDGSGILLYHSSGNTITGNNITNHDYAGIYLDTSSGNIFYHNNFLNNYYQVYGSYSANAWDGGYPSGGNYWSDYTGVDEKSGPNQDQPGSDGIGDIPFFIGDRYPLMNPLGSPQPPIALFAQFPQYAVIDEAVVFNASTSYDRDGSIINFEWDFGDGNVTTVTTSVISHVYVAPGTYSVNLTVTDNDGLSSSVAKSLTAKLSSSITLYVDPLTVAFGSNVIINGTIAPIRVGVNVAIYISGPSSESVTVKTDSNSNFSYTWKPMWAGSYEIKASWSGDDLAFPAESESTTVSVYEYVIYIKTDGSVDPSTAPIQREGDVYFFTGDVFGPPIVVERDDVVVDGNGHTLEGLGYGEGVSLFGRTNVTIKNLRIDSFGYGIRLQDTMKSTISNNVIVDIMWGGIFLYLNNSLNTLNDNRVMRSNASDYSEWSISLYASNNNAIINNTVVGSPIMVGYPYYPSSGNTVASNNITGSGIEVRGYSDNNVISDNFGGCLSLLNMWSNTHIVLRGNNLTGFSMREIWDLPTYLGLDIDASNLLNGKPIRYFVNQTDLTLDSSSPEIGYLALVNSSNILVENLRSSIHGILLAYTRDSIIQNVSITDSLDGVSLVASGENRIQNNVISSNKNGIYIDWTSNNTIVYENNITNNDYGILVLSFDNTISENNIANNSGYGITIEGSVNAISANNVTENEVGIALGYSSYNNTICRNTIGNNTVGISDGPVSYPLYTKIYHNNFIDNTQQANTYGGSSFDDGYPSGGNYWSDYIGTDSYSGYSQNETGSDGVGDASFNCDRYPLMNPWDSPQPPIGILTCLQEDTTVGETVRFDASASGDRDGYIASYRWDFDDGNVTTTSDPVVWHVYSTPSSYTVKLTVTDDNGLTHNTTKLVVVKLYRSVIDINVDHALIPFGSNVTVSGVITPLVTNAPVTIFYRLLGGIWEPLVEVQTDLDSYYSLVWQVPDIGCYEVKASWLGNELLWSAESEVEIVATRIAVKSDGSIDPPDVPISRDGDLYSLTGDIFVTLVLEKNNIVVDGAGYMIQGIGAGKGIDISYRDNVTLKDTKVTGFECGIYVYSSSNTTLIGIDAVNNYYGICLYSTNGNTLLGNVIMSNNYGLVLSSTKCDLVEDSDISNNAESGIYLIGDLGGSVVKGNRLTQNKNGISSGGNTVSGVTILDNIVHSNENGIYLCADNSGYGGDLSAYVYNITISDNSVYSGRKGIWLYSKGSSSTNWAYGSASGRGFINDITISNNSVTSGEDGIQLCSYGYGYHPYYRAGEAYVYNLVIANNSVSSLQEGISLYAYANGWAYMYASVYSIKILNNSVQSNGNGIHLHASNYYGASIHDIIVSTNSVSSGGTGIYIYASASSSGTLYGGGRSSTIIYGIDILDNSILSNSDGIYLYTSAYAYSDLYTVGEIARAQINSVDILSNSLSFNGNGILLYAYASASSRDGYVWAYCSIEDTAIQPVAQFSYTPEHPLLGEVVVFNASSSYDFDGTIANYTWDFGDGNVTTVTDPAIAHTYVAEGLYTVTLTVTDNSGFTENETKTMPVDVTPPTTLNDYDGSWHTTDFTINLAASDNISGVAEIYYRINDGPIQNVSTSGYPHITTEGANNKLEYWSVDNAGNEEGHHILTGIELDKTYPTIETPSRTPGGYVQPDQSVKVSVNVTDAMSGVENVTLSYTINDGMTWTDLPMNHTASNLYEATIPPQQAGTTVRFKIAAYDCAGNNATLGETEPYHTYQVIPEFPTVMILPLFIVLTLFAVMFAKKRKMRETRFGG
jgi:parallel beta-helix repeat protein